MFSTTSMRFIRLAIASISGGSLALFIIVLTKVLDPRFPSINEGVTSLPIFGLGISIIYNVAAFLLASWLSSKRLLIILSDLTIASVVATLGGIGWVHDNKHYLSNGMWEMYDNPGWLEMEVGAGILLIIVVLLHLAVALAIIFTSKKKSNKETTICLPYEGYPPVQRHADDARSFISDGELGKEEAMYASSSPSEAEDSTRKAKDDDVKFLHFDMADFNKRLEV